MSIYEIVILSVALALDALIVSFSYGMIIKENRLKNALILSLSFGIFQLIMPIFGWLFTGIVYSYLEKYSKWVVSLVFLILSLKFLKEAFSEKEVKPNDCISVFCVLGLAIATSIDAFGAGVSIKLLNNSVFIPSLLIGIITFGLSLSGFYTAGIFAKLESKYIEIFGSMMLLYLAIKALM